LYLKIKKNNKILLEEEMNLKESLETINDSRTDFSEFTKAKSLSISGKQMLCDKREECLEKVCRNI